ncbi:MAG: right-handed parallel beta-helix repeat-containing protein, partial [Daejeonella sp.]
MKKTFTPISSGFLSILKTFKKAGFMLGLITATIVGTASAQTILYVTPTGGSAIQNGQSWATAYPGGQLQTRINAAAVSYANTGTKTEIWVQAGTYVPALNPVSGSIDNRDKTFLLKDGVALYGGFNGTETLLSKRNLATGGATILSGDIDNNSPANITGDAYHVVVTVGANSTTILDGFTIQYGNANGSGFGTISGTGITRTNGGGIYNASSDPTLRNNTFIANNALSSGGGIYNTLSSPVIINTVFSDNTANDLGGAMYNNGSSPQVINSTFSKNKATTSGGAIRNSMSLANPVFTNSIIYGNMKTSLVADNFGDNSSVVTYSLVEGGYNGGTNIILSDPLFVNAATGNFQLQPKSPAIGVGNNAGIPAGITRDRNSELRIQKTTVDMGAYESAYSTLTGNANGVVYVKKGSTGDLSGDSWANAITDVADALHAAQSNTAIKEIW